MAPANARPQIPAKRRLCMLMTFICRPSLPVPFADPPRRPTSPGRHRRFAHHDPHDADHEYRPEHFGGLKRIAIFDNYAAEAVNGCEELRHNHPDDAEA